MKNNVFYSLLAVFFVSLISFIGIFTLSFKKEKLKNILIYFISFSAGSLFGDVFFHLLPEAIEEKFTINISLFIILGIVSSFILEKILSWRHCHLPITKNHIHCFAYMNLWGDFFHNFIDGLAIAASYLVDFKTGVATSLAVIFHEIPQEIGDFGVLVYGGFKPKKALFINFLTSFSAFFGVIVGLLLNRYLENINSFLLPFSSGNFIYIAGTDLIPELHKEGKIKEGIKQIIAFLVGVFIMYLLLLIIE